MKRIIFTATAASLALTMAAPTLAQTGNNITAPEGSQANTARDQRRDTKDTYVVTAGAGDLFEIESSRLALQRSQNEEIRSFAQMMIDGHTKTSEDVMAAARDLRMNPQAPKLSAEHAKMMEELRNASDAHFDHVYVENQIKAHRMALNVHRNYADGGDAPQLREVAKTIVPAVEQHLAQLDTMKKM